MGFVWRWRFLAAAVVASAAQGPSGRTRRPPPRLRPTPCRSRCRWIRKSLVGTLPNGLRYYVRANGKPGHRAELRLVVKAGSVLEDDDQQGLAHFVEHMEFEGTEHFPQQSIVDFLSSLGLSIGPDANAATSYDDTQYTLRVPTDVPGVLDRALLVLEDWAHGASFDQSGIDHERGIVLAEWRLHLGAGRADAGQNPPRAARRIALRGSAADRQPRHHRARAARATDAVLPRLVPARPDGGHRRRRCRSRRRRDDDQGSLFVAAAPSPERPRPAFDVPDHPGTRYAIVTDKETTATTRRRSATFGRRATRARLAAIAS